MCLLATLCTVFSIYTVYRHADLRFHLKVQGFAERAGLASFFDIATFDNATTPRHAILRTIALTHRYSAQCDWQQFFHLIVAIHLSCVPSSVNLQL